MAGIALYDIAVPTFTRGLKTLDHILARAEEHAASVGVDADAAFPRARLIADQNPLAFQVLNAARTVRANVGRLTGAAVPDEPPQDETTETFATLHARVRAALDLLDTVDPAVANSRADETIDV